MMTRTVRRFVVKPAGDSLTGVITHHRAVFYLYHSVGFRPAVTSQDRRLYYMPYVNPLRVGIRELATEKHVVAGTVALVSEIPPLSIPSLMTTTEDRMWAVKLNSK